MKKSYYFKHSLTPIWARISEKEIEFLADFNFPEHIRSGLSPYYVSTFSIPDEDAFRQMFACLKATGYYIISSADYLKQVERFAGLEGVSTDNPFLKGL